jgi:hypothetical protein
MYYKNLCWEVLYEFSWQVIYFLGNICLFDENIVILNTASDIMKSYRNSAKRGPLGTLVSFELVLIPRCSHLCSVCQP